MEGPPSSFRSLLLLSDVPGDKLGLVFVFAVDEDDAFALVRVLVLDTSSASPSVGEIEAIILCVEGESSMTGVRVGNELLSSSTGSSSLGPV